MLMSCVVYLLVPLQCGHGLVQFHVDLAEVKECVHSGELLQGRLELRLSLTIQT